MATPVRGPRGDPVKSYTASETKHAFGEVLQTVARDGIVAITRHEKPRAVLLSIEAYEALVKPRDSVLDTLKREFDAMVASMNAPGAHARMLGVFSASPKDIGALALKHARRKRGA